MRAAVLRDKRIVVDEVPEPEPGPGQVLVRTLACGICGSDLHALHHADEMAAVAEECGLPRTMDPARDVVMGHEFCAEILDFGPNTLRNLAPGDRVCSMPLVFHPGGVGAVGYSNDFPGGYGERMVLSEPMLLRVPDDLPTEAAALTEPMAVGVHAVAKAELAKGEAPLVVGCGPVGLAVVAALALRGVEPIVAADYSPRRRELAAGLGAHVVVDPAEASAFAELAKAAGARSPVVFECVGVPGLLHTLMRDAPPRSRLVVAGACMEDDRIKPLIGIQKELQIQFVLGYAPEEFSQALAALADGRIEAAPLVTGRVGIPDVADAFEDLGRPDAHAKILVEPWRS
ncbi:MAG: zinc-binding dehydrogenase [Myxococcota bacterium]|nr:zinc-binding dehydrogenase [Myxococcota bacterium]